MRDDSVKQCLFNFVLIEALETILDINGNDNKANYPDDDSGEEVFTVVTVKFKWLSPT